ncbi:hypothetical protein VTL71DRAFT_6921 [Oculimacula yallundae]|uniref:Uncharacterized protein n=1 Tax=Oculimacula yallundae TaxID=86028 RepID=A0ABR4BV72_9HELO
MGLFKTGLILYGAHSAAKRGYSAYSDHKQSSNQGQQQQPQPQQFQPPTYEQTQQQIYQQAPPLPPRNNSQTNLTWAEREYQQWEEKNRAQEVGGQKRCACGGN